MTSEIIQANDDGVVHARISGVMTPDDQRALEATARRLIDDGRTVSLLVTLDDFLGWKTDPAWGDDLDFNATHGGHIDRIAIVGDPRWRGEAFLYVGKGFRRADVEFFNTDQLDAARRWLLG